MKELMNIIEDYERQERNLADMDDSRFAEIYLEDITPARKENKQKIRKMKKESKYDRNY
jgi:hypothetical protein